jgi:hypothetical protein
MVVHAAGPPRHAHHGVDHEMVIRIDVEQEILAALGGRPFGRMRLQSCIRHELLEQRLGFRHAALVFRIRRPDGAELADEPIEDRQS